MVGRIALALACLAIAGHAKCNAALASDLWEVPREGVVACQDLKTLDFHQSLYVRDRDLWWTALKRDIERGTCVKLLRGELMKDVQGGGAIRMATGKIVFTPFFTRFSDADFEKMKKTMDEIRVDAARDAFERKRAKESK